MKKRALPVILAGVLAVSTLMAGYTYQDGFGYVYYESEREIARDTYIKEQLSGHPENGIEHAYMITTDTTNGVVQPMVFMGEVTSKTNLKTMITWIENSGYKVIAGINGDIYDTSSGTPKGLTIHNGRIKTSGYEPETVIAFDYSGRAFAAWGVLNYSMNGTLQEQVYTEQGEPTGEYVTRDFALPVTFFNVPYGAARGLHLYNRQYGATTRTSGSCVEVVLQANSANDAELTVGGTVTATVVSVNPSTASTPIGDDQLVLSSPEGSDSSWALMAMVPGTTVEIKVSDSTGMLDEAKEVMGVYHVIAQNGQVTATTNAIHPRTAVGIKGDGSLMIYAVDGRQASVSAGLGLVDVAKHMVAQGCVAVFNMDGGGSTTMVARYPGIEDTASVVNSPSEGNLRAVTNGLFLVYTGQGGSSAQNIHVYSAMTLAMPGAEVSFDTYATNASYEPVNLPSYVNYSVISGEGTFSNNTLTAGEKTGLVEIQAESGGLTATAKVQVVDDIIFTPSVTSLVIDPQGTKDIDVTAKFGYASVTAKDDLFTWRCDPDLGTIDENGVFTAGSIPAVSGNIYVEYNGQTKTIPVQVGGTKITFNDIQDHWAKSYIEDLASRRIVSGMGDNLYMPDAQLTRAQFLTMLAMSSGDDPSQSAASGFWDVSSEEWYYNYVNWGVEKGIVRGLDETTFAPNNNITREQMAVMLTNFAVLMDKELQDIQELTFTDQEQISEWAYEAVSTIVATGIMSGRPEGNFDPQGSATRAEAVTVVYKLTIEQ